MESFMLLSKMTRLSYYAALMITVSVDKKNCRYKQTPKPALRPYGEQKGIKSTQKQPSCKKRCGLN